MRAYYFLAAAVCIAVYIAITGCLVPAGLLPENFSVVCGPRIAFDYTSLEWTAIGFALTGLSILESDGRLNVGTVIGCGYCLAVCYCISDNPIGAMVAMCAPVVFSYFLELVLLPKPTDK